VYWKVLSDIKLLSYWRYFHCTEAKYNYISIIRGGNHVTFYNSNNLRFLLPVCYKKFEIINQLSLSIIKRNDWWYLQLHCRFSCLEAKDNSGNHDKFLYFFFLLYSELIIMPHLEYSGGFRWGKTPSYQKIDKIMSVRLQIYGP
jgi:hypothetical protein